MPKVVQFNKRDLPDVKPLQEIKQAWGDIPTYPAVAIRGEGVLETFRALLRALYRSMEERHSFGEKFGVSEQDFLKGILTGLCPLSADRPFRRNPAVSDGATAGFPEGRPTAFAHAQLLADN